MKKLLIIEDDQALATTIRNYFKMKGFELVMADNGAKGIQYAFAEIPDCIVCDINIPVADGYQVYKILSETSPANTIPFVFLTAKTSLEEIRKGLQLGADDYITKPFQLDDLYQTVETRINKRAKLFAQNEAQLQQLIFNSPFPTFVCQDNRFTLFNTKLEELLKFGKEELHKRHLLMFIQNNRDELATALSAMPASDEKNCTMDIVVTDRFQQQHTMRLFAAGSVYLGKPCIVGNLIAIAAHEALTQNKLSKPDVENIIHAIEALDADHRVVPVTLINKLYDIFRHSAEPERNSASLPELSERELEVFGEICLGKSTHEIAAKLFISERTVEKHRAAILLKTKTRNTVEAVIFGIRNGMVVM